MSTMQFVLAVLAGLVASECTELVSWLAARLMAWAVRHRYRDPLRAGVRAEELQAVLADRPTKLLKLATATGFAAVTLTAQAGRGAQSLATAGRRILRDIQNDPDPAEVATLLFYAVFFGGTFASSLVGGVIGDLIGAVTYIGFCAVGLAVGLLGAVDVVRVQVRTARGAWHSRGRR